MNKIIFLLILSLVAGACSRLSEDDAMKQARSALEQKKTDEAIKFFEIIIKEFPDGKATPDAMLYLASMYQNEKKDLTRASGLYEEVFKKFPRSDAAPKALFSEAFMQANQLNDLAKAKELYEKFLELYPNHEMARSAKSEIENLGLDPAVVLESMQQKQVSAAERKSK